MMNTEMINDDPFADAFKTNSVTASDLNGEVNVNAF